MDHLLPITISRVWLFSKTANLQNIFQMLLNAAFGNAILSSLNLFAIYLKRALTLLIHFF